MRESFIGPDPDFFFYGRKWIRLYLPWIVLGSSYFSTKIRNSALKANNLERHLPEV